MAYPYSVTSKGGKAQARKPGMKLVFEGIVGLGMIMLGAPVVLDIMEPWVASGGTIESIPGIFTSEIAYWRLFPIFFGFTLVVRVIVGVIRSPMGK